MRIAGKLLLVLLLVVVTVGCGEDAPCPTPGPGMASAEIPDCIRQKADQIAISRLGRRFFSEHVRFEPALSGYHEAEPMCVQDPANCAQFLVKPYYSIAYSFTVPEMPSVELSGGFTLDAAGNLVTEVGIDGLPDCRHDPSECRFKVTDSDSAIAIAKQTGLEPGLSEWRTHFHWYAGEGEMATYIWTVENTLTADEAYGNKSGRTVLIDANSGKVLAISGWEMTP